MFVIVGLFGYVLYVFVDPRYFGITIVFVGFGTLINALFVKNEYASEFAIAYTETDAVEFL